MSEKLELKKNELDEGFQPYHPPFRLLACRREAETARAEPAFAPQPWNSARALPAVLGGFSTGRGVRRHSSCILANEAPT